MIDTSKTFEAAYTVAAILFIAYPLTIWWRARRVRQRLEARRAA